MTDEEFLKEVIRRGKTADKGYFELAHLAAVLLPRKLVEQLQQLVNGPVWDGDVISKDYRDDLLALGLAVRCCCRGEQGFTAATYFAYSVEEYLEILHEIAAGKRGA